MNQGQEVNHLRKPRILVAPLDWGLGHATRCIPLIHELLQLDCEPWLAAEGSQAALLGREFPMLPQLSLPGYRVRYGRTTMGLLLGIARQSTQILHAIRSETDWLKKMHARHHFDAVISDNRFGLIHPGVPAIFITHQLRIRTPFGSWSERWLQKKNYAFIERFSECWIPDLPGDKGLAGALSHPADMPANPAHYIGPLTRFHLPAATVKEEKGRLLVLLSGPEPQRSMLETLLLAQLSSYLGKVTFVRGLPGGGSPLPLSAHILFHDHLPAKELQEELVKAEFVVARSGYSTVMDVMAMKKKTILIPTPGQTEQEYLASHLQQRRFALAFRQKNFQLGKALKEAADFTYQFPTTASENLLRPILNRFVHSLR